MSTQHDQIETTLNQLRGALARRIRWVTRIVIIVFSLVVVLSRVFPHSLEWLNRVLRLPESNLFTWLGLALLVGILERVFVVEEIITNRSLHIEEKQDEMYNKLINLVKESGAKQAFLIQYSSVTCHYLVKTLLENGAEVTVYIQAPETASEVGSLLQKERIEQKLRDLPNELADLDSPGKLHLVQYAAPASISGVLIDRAFLGVGWYVYKHVDETNKDKVRPGDRVQILGHNQPGVLVRGGTPEFNKLYKCFMQMKDNFDRNGKPVKLPGAADAQR